MGDLESRKRTYEDYKASIKGPKPAERPEEHVTVLEYKNFRHASSLKDHALVPCARCTVLRGSPTAQQLAQLEMSAADAFAYHRRHANEGLPAIGLTLGRFGGRPLLAADVFDHTVGVMDGAGLIGSKFAHLLGKCELKRVCRGSDPPWEVTGGGNGYAFKGDWAKSLVALGLDPRASMCTPKHRDSGPQNLNHTFIRGEVITVNTDPDAILIHFRVVMVVSGADMIMLLRVPTYDSKGEHVSWEIKSVLLRPGDLFIFHDSTGALLEHAAAVALPNGCTTYVVFDIHLDANPPAGVEPPPPPTTLACPLASGSWWPADFVMHSMPFWTCFHEERSALVFLSGNKQREAAELEVTIFVARRDARASGLELPVAAMPLMLRWTALLVEGRSARGTSGAEACARTFLGGFEQQQERDLRAAGKHEQADALLAKGHTDWEESMAVASMDDAAKELYGRLRAEDRNEEADDMLDRARSAKAKKANGVDLHELHSLQAAHGDVVAMLPLLKMSFNVSISDLSAALGSVLDKVGAEHSNALKDIVASQKEHNKGAPSAHSRLAVQIGLQEYAAKKETKKAKKQAKKAPSRTQQQRPAPARPPWQMTVWQ